MQIEKQVKRTHKNRYERKKDIFSADDSNGTRRPKKFIIGDVT